MVIVVVSLSTYSVEMSVTFLLQTVNLPEFDGRGLSTVRKFESNQLPANTPNEDRRSVAACLQVTITVRLPSPSKPSLLTRCMFFLSSPVKGNALWRV